MGNPLIRPKLPAELDELLDDIFARNRARFAGYTMLTVEEDGDDADTDDDDADDQDDQGDGDGDGDGDEFTPPTKEEWERTRDALKKANGEARKNRLALKEAREAAESGEGDDKAAKAAEAKWKPKVINSAARAALLDAGAEKPERLLRLLDSDDLDVDDEGKVEGLDDEVDRLKDEYPELFTTKRKRTKVETGDRGNGSGGGKAKSATERQAEMLTRR